MARTTKQLSGGGKDKFLRGVVARAASSSEESARVADLLCSAVTEVRVRRDVWEDVSRGGMVAVQAPVDEPQRRPVSQASDRTDAPVAFDPFAFSAVAVLARKGAAGLMAELARIDDPQSLRRLAEAQHLVISEASEEPDALRRAIVGATEQRIAERRAAAS